MQPGVTVMLLLFIGHGEGNGESVALDANGTDDDDGKVDEGISPLLFKTRGLDILTLRESVESIGAFKEHPSAVGTFRTEERDVGGLFEVPRFLPL